VVDLILRFWDVIKHMDQYLSAWVQTMGGWLYVLLFAIIFAETGLVVTPFLPGDSLLFAVGALCAVTPSLNVVLMMALLLVAAVLGDAVNYWVGKTLGPKVFTSEKSRLLNKKHLLRTQAFYEKYGGKTIIIARFIPIIRTFAPFVAGIGKMQYRRFFIFNVVGAIAWICLFVPAGYWLGNTKVVKDRFHIIIIAIIIISVMPAVIEFIREWRGRSSQLARTAGAADPSPPR
jgi:membrane-associated protein